MRIVHVNTEPTWRGGENQVFHLMTGQIRRGHEVEAVALPGGLLAQRCTEASIPVTTIPMRADLDVRAAWRLARHLRRRRPDVVNAQTSRAHSLSLIARHLGAPGRLVVTRRLDFPIRPHPANLWKYRSRRIDRYIAVADVVADMIVAAGVDASRVRVINSSIVPDRFVADPGAREAIRRELGIPPGAPVVGNVAALAWHKGQCDLIAALPHIVRSHPGTVCVIVGEGEERASLERRAAALGGEGRVVFTGRRTDVARVLAAFDVFCMPSHFEGLCNSVLEAFAAGVPVVATRAGGLPEIVEDGVTGLLAPPRDPAGLAAAVARLLSDRDLGARLARAGGALVRDRFTVETMVDRTIALYGELIESHPREAAS